MNDYFETMAIYNEDGLLYVGGATYIIHIWDSLRLNDDYYKMKYNGLDKPIDVPKHEDLDQEKFPLRLVHLLDTLG